MRDTTLYKDTATGMIGTLDELEFESFPRSNRSFTKFKLDLERVYLNFDNLFVTQEELEYSILKCVNAVEILVFLDSTKKFMENDFEIHDSIKYHKYTEGEIQAIRDVLRNISSTEPIDDEEFKSRFGEKFDRFFGQPNLVENVELPIIEIENTIYSPVPYDGLYFYKNQKEFFRNFLTFNTLLEITFGNERLADKYGICVPEDCRFSSLKFEFRKIRRNIMDWFSDEYLGENEVLRIFEGRDELISYFINEIVDDINFNIINPEGDADWDTVKENLEGILNCCLNEKWPRC